MCFWESIVFISNSYLVDPHLMLVHTYVAMVLYIVTSHDQVTVIIRAQMNSNNVILVFKYFFVISE